jgi:hypothetical protein
VWWFLDSFCLPAPRGKEGGNYRPFSSHYCRRDSDESKNDNLVKALALIQVIWLGIQLSIRANTGRQSSQPEFMALAFAICGFITYVLLIQRPKDVNTPTII